MLSKNILHIEKKSINIKESITGYYRVLQGITGYYNIKKGAGEPDLPLCYANRIIKVWRVYYGGVEDTTKIFPEDEPYRNIS